MLKAKLHRACVTYSGVVEPILLSLKQPSSSIDDEWADVAANRFNELRKGNIQAVEGTQVFNKIWQRCKQ